MAKAGSLEPLGRYGVEGLPTVTLLSADRAPAGVGGASAPLTDIKTRRMIARRIVLPPLEETGVRKPTAPAAEKASPPGEITEARDEIIAGQIQQKCPKGLLS